MISIEAYRAAIGRFYGKSKRKDKFQTFNYFDTTFLNRFDMTFIFIMTLFLMVITPFVIDIGINLFSICMEYISLIKIFTPLIMTYCYGLMVTSICTDLLAITFQKKVNRDVLIQMSPKIQNTNDEKTSQVEPLIQCKYIDTIILDGRHRSRIVVEKRLCMGN